MKKLMFCWVLSFLFLSTAYAQYGTTRTGYDGDFFSLEGALELFKQSHTLRDFERRLNTEDHWVNNLDLDYDGRIDYIRVEHRRQGDFHAIILQALVGRYDVQDVAVIEIEMIGRRQAILQIVGDEGLYGEEVIVEPAEGYTDSRTGYHSNYGSYVNVYYWNPVQYILGRQYVVYASPYRWQYYPSWWRPWVPCAWSIFRPRIVIYHRHYHVVHVHRVVRVHHFYTTHRSYSYSVVQRTNAVRVKQGKPPIHRPGPAFQQERKSSGHSSRKSYEQRSSATRPSTPGQSPSVSRKRTEPSGQKAAGNTSPQVNPKSRNSADRPGTIRSTTPTNKPSAKSRKATSSYEQKAARTSTAPQVKQPSRRTKASSGTSVRSTSPSRKPSGSSRTAPSNQTKAKRNTPSNVRQQSSRTTPRSSTVTRSNTSSRKPSASSRKSTTSAKPKASPGKSSNSKGSSRSRGGG